MVIRWNRPIFQSFMKKILTNLRIYYGRTVYSTVTSFTFQTDAGPYTAKAADSLKALYSNVVGQCDMFSTCALPIYWENMG